MDYRRVPCLVSKLGSAPAVSAPKLCCYPPLFLFGVGNTVVRGRKKRYEMKICSGLRLMIMIYVKRGPNIVMLVEAQI